MKLYGYFILPYTQFELSHRQLVNIEGSMATRRTVRTVMADVYFRVLLYMVQNADKDIIRDDEIVATVWGPNAPEKIFRELNSIIDDLRIMLAPIGAGNYPLITRVGNEGYKIKSDMIEPLYSQSPACAA